MQTIHHHWAWVVALPVLATAVLLVLVQRELELRIARAESPAGLGAAQRVAVNPQAAHEAIERYQHIQQLRAKLALTTQDRAALGVSASTASQFLTSVKSFVQSSPANLAAADTACADASGDRLCLPEEKVLFLRKLLLTSSVKILL